MSRPMHPTPRPPSTRRTIPTGARRGPIPPPGGVVLALALALAGACDESTAQKMVDASHATPPVVDATPPVVDATPPVALEQQIAGYDRCYRECFTARTSETNRETCKLQCDSLAEDDLRARADPAARVMVQHLRGCMLACWEDSHLSETNRETCLLTCDGDAAVDGTPPPKATLEPVPGAVTTPAEPAAPAAAATP